MTEHFSDNKKWSTFENSGRVADYLSYRGIGSKRLPVSREVSEDAHNNGGSGDIRSGRGGQ